MKKELIKSETRGIAEHGWLHSKFSFSFAEYYDTKRIHFGMLRVLNDDIIEPSGGFDTHPHDNMEIITIPLSGSLRHRDSTGGGSIIKTNDVQIMSAGSGLMHSEFNDSDTDLVNLLQIWVYPKVKNITPRYDQLTFSHSDRQNKIHEIVSPVKADNKLWINQDAYFSLADYDAGKEITYNVNLPGNGVYIFLIEGNIEAEGEKLSPRDAIQIYETNAINLKTTEKSFVLFIEIPMN